MDSISLLGLPLDCGAARRGASLGPGALRIAGLADALRGLGHAVRDHGDLIPRTWSGPHPGGTAHDVAECAGWVAAQADIDMGEDVAVFLGGDHLMAAVTVPAMIARAARRGRPLHVLWLDAHSDFHDPRSTASGNLHGTPVAYATGAPGFDAFPRPLAAVAPRDVTMIGLRSVDGPERVRLRAAGVRVHDMRALDESGIAAPVRAALARAAAAGADLHVSLDVDFLDPALAPAVGTTVPGGATFREAHLVMEMLHESGRVTSLDLAELDPMRDERGRTAHVLVDLAASLFGRAVLGRPGTGHPPHGNPQETAA